MTSSAKIGKREDKLPLERALRALEDVHKSLKEFSKEESVADDIALSVEIKVVRHKTKRLRKRTTALATLWTARLKRFERKVYPKRDRSVEVISLPPEEPPCRRSDGFPSL
jgi:hypothetical protein